MKPETRTWLDYAEQDEQAAEMLLNGRLDHPCLYHAQQAIEKCLNAALCEREVRLPRIHSIRGLVNLFAEDGVTVAISDDEIDLIDTIFMPARYPVGSALPIFEPDQAMCVRCLAIVRQVNAWAAGILNADRHFNLPDMDSEGAGTP